LLADSMIVSKSVASTEFIMCRPICSIMQAVHHSLGDARKTQTGTAIVSRNISFYRSMVNCQEFNTANPPIIRNAM
jgi:hypothetical protein